MKSVSAGFALALGLWQPVATLLVDRIAGELDKIVSDAASPRVAGPETN